MSAPAVERPQQNLAVQQSRELRVVQDDSALSFIMDTARFEHLQRIASVMSNDSFIPAHLVDKNDPKRSMANCFRVVNQAMRWGFDPYGVADESYVVRGKLGYQGKLIAAVVNARSNLVSGLRCVYNAKRGDELAVVVYGITVVPVPETCQADLAAYAESEDRQALSRLNFAGVLAIRLAVGQAKTDNKMWTTDPEQKLFYSGATKWARRHRPEIMLGVLTDDDVDQINRGSDVLIEQGHVNRLNGHGSNPPKTADAVSELLAGAAHATKPEAPKQEEPEKQESAPKAEPAKKEPRASDYVLGQLTNQIQRLGLSTARVKTCLEERGCKSMGHLTEAKAAEWLKLLEDEPGREPGDDGE